jgi:Ulp1 family protease
METIKAKVSIVLVQHVLWIFTFALQVPLQPNSCDCGVYVLHFVRVFLSDPVLFTEFFQVAPVFNPISQMLTHPH